MVRRVAAIGTPEALALLVDALGKVETPAQRLGVARGDQRGAEGAPPGRRCPAAWPEVFAALAKDADPEVRSQATALGLTFGDASALAALRAVLADPKADAGLGRRRWRPCSRPATRSCRRPCRPSLDRARLSAAGPGPPRPRGLRRPETAEVDPQGLSATSPRPRSATP